MKHVLVIIMVAIVTTTAAAVVPSKPDPNDTNDLHLFEPFWKSKINYQESVFFVQEADDQLPSASLLFEPVKIIWVKSARGEITYQRGADYFVRANSRRLELPEGSRIPFKKRNELYLKNGHPNSIAHKLGDPNTSLYFGEGHVFHDQQVEVTYTHCGRWKGYVPQFAGKNLPKTMAKLRDGHALKVCLSGDSISVGANASGFTGAPPYMPPYGWLVINQLERVYGSKITFKNFAVGGWQSDHGRADAIRVAAEKPDLVIVAYGMNDVYQRNPQAYKANIAGIIETVRDINPDAEFMLIATMVGNSEWHRLAVDQFAKYRDALEELTRSSIVLADMTALWADMLQFKKFYDITGNGVNHPNDFGHRLYAQVLLAMLVESR